MRKIPSAQFFPFALDILRQHRLELDDVLGEVFRLRNQERLRSREALLQGLGAQAQEEPVSLVSPPRAPLQGLRVGCLGVGVGMGLQRATIASRPQVVTYSQSPPPQPAGAQHPFEVSRPPRRPTTDRNARLCVCLLLQDLVQSCLRGEGGILEDMCYERRRAEACVDQSAHHALVNAGEREIV